MDEYIDVVTKKGKPTGQKALKSEIHKKGLYHHTAHIWLYTKQGEILLAQRSSKKTICPLLWDVSVAGHVDAGETVKQAAIREIKEEIGLLISENDLQPIGIFECFKTYKNGIIDNEFHNTYISEINIDINTLTPQPEEVEAIKLVSSSDFEILLKQSEINMHFVASNRTYYKFVLQCIKEAIKN